MKSLIKKTSLLFSLSLLLAACGGKEAKKTTTEKPVVKTATTKTLEIEKPQLRFGLSN